MIDGYGREIDHLRLSLTEHCNLACRYCAPEGGAPTVGSAPGIDPDFAYEAVRWLSQQGIRHVRLTGGEPLLYRHLVPLVKRLAALGTLHEITLTTNAQALAGKAEALRDAGLTRVNISLDTLDAECFAHQTRGGNAAHTLAGIEAAIRAGLTPIKINVVAQRGVNDQDLADIAEWGLQRGCVVRFLEVMPIGPMAHVYEQHLVPAAEIIERLGERFELRQIPQTKGQPAEDFAASKPGLRGVIGIIAATTRPFCSRCRRLRLTSRGHLIACVHDQKHFDISGSWNGRSLDLTTADAALHQAVMNKPEVGPRDQAFTMLTMGG